LAEEDAERHQDCADSGQAQVCDEPVSDRSPEVSKGKDREGRETDRQDGLGKLKYIPEEKEHQRDEYSDPSGAAQEDLPGISDSQTSRHALRPAAQLFGKG
jgi:hypothetical protein